MSTPKVIVTDMDDVLVDLLSAWVRTLNFKYRENVSVEDITEWDMTKVFPNLCPQQIYEVLGDDIFWGSVQPRKDAVEGLRALHEMGYVIYVCTATHYKNIATKLSCCLLKYFPWLTYKDIIMCHNKQMINCDYIIDDYADNIKGHKAVKFLMSAPHNKTCNEDLYDFRVNTFKDVIEIIHELEATEK